MNRLFVLTILLFSVWQAQATTLTCMKKNGSARREFSLNVQDESVQVASKVILVGDRKATDFVFLNEGQACNQPLANLSDCVVRELSDARDADAYSFIFACPGNLSGDIHYSKNSVVASCFQGSQTLTRFQIGDCSIGRKGDQ